MTLRVEKMDSDTDRAYWNGVWVANIRSVVLRGNTFYYLFIRQGDGSGVEGEYKTDKQKVLDELHELFSSGRLYAISKEKQEEDSDAKEWKKLREDLKYYLHWFKRCAYDSRMDNLPKAYAGVFETAAKIKKLLEKVNA